MRLLSHVWSIARGSVAGITYTANQWHQIVARARTAPVQPQSNLQNIVRGAFSNAVKGWTLMSAGQRLNWDAYAATCTFQGPLGPYTVPGRQMWIATETFRLFLNNAFMTSLPLSYDAPTKAGWLSIGPITVVAPAAGNSGYSLSIPNPMDEDVTVLANRSIAFDISRNSFKGPWVPFAGEWLDIVTLTAGRVDFYALGPGDAYFGDVRGISSDAPYRLSELQYYRAESVTTPP